MPTLAEVQLEWRHRVQDAFWALTLRHLPLRASDRVFVSPEAIADVPDGARPACSVDLRLRGTDMRLERR